MLNNFLNEMLNAKPEYVQLAWTITSEKMMITVSYADKMYQSTENVVSEYAAAATFLNQHFNVNRRWKDINEPEIRDFTEYKN